MTAIAATLTIGTLTAALATFHQQQPLTTSSTSTLHNLLHSITNPRSLLQSSPEQFDAAQWDLFPSLLLCLDMPTLHAATLPLFAALCELMPPRELLLIATPALQTTHNMSTRLLISVHLRTALNRTERRRAKLLDDYLSMVRRSIQHPLLTVDDNNRAHGAHGVPGSDDESDESDESDDNVDTMFSTTISNMPSTYEDRVRLSIRHAHHLLSHLSSAPGPKVKAAQLAEETCCLRAAVVNFACLTLEDYATVSVSPLPNAHGTSNRLYL